MSESVVGSHAWEADLRHGDPARKICDQSGNGRNKHQHDPDDAHKRDIEFKIAGDSGTYAGDLFPFTRP
jgi:hypothetical protein